MGEESQLQQEAQVWFNDHVLPKLEYKQDYAINVGASEKMFDPNDPTKQTGIKIRRGHLLLFQTGVEKMYRMLIKGEELPTIKYTKHQERQFDKEHNDQWEKNNV